MNYLHHRRRRCHFIHPPSPLPPPPTLLPHPQAELKPKEWLREVKAGASLEIKFGGTGAMPSSLVFTQILPLLDPEGDESLKKRGAFPAKASVCAQMQLRVGCG